MNHHMSGTSLVSINHKSSDFFVRNISIMFCFCEIRDHGFMALECFDGNQCSAFQCLNYSSQMCRTAASHPVAVHVLLVVSGWVLLLLPADCFHSHCPPLASPGFPRIVGGPPTINITQQDPGWWVVNPDACKGHHAFGQHSVVRR